MRHPLFRAATLAIVPLLTGCAADRTPAPSLAPRAAEKIDPRVPVGGTAMAMGPVDPTLAVRLMAAVAKARRGEPLFAERLAVAQRAAASAGPAPGEGWIAAQEALSALVAAHAPASDAAADIDSQGAERLAARGDIAPQDRAAIGDASARVAAISEGQAAAIARLSAALGR